MARSIAERIAFRHISAAVAAAMISFATTPALSKDSSGNDLYELCSAKLGSFESGLCYGKVTAYYETLHLTFVCKEENGSITPKQFFAIEMKYYNDYPNQRSQVAWIGATAAILRAFDCNKPEKEKGAN